mgnify:FL=1
MRIKILKNIIFLYGLSIAKIIFPLLTLPYLTRVLSVDCYGVVAYVKAMMQYMQITVDFGFMLSGTKDIVNARDDREKLEREIGDIFIARLFLAFLSLLGVLIMILILPVLHSSAIYTLLSYGTVFLSIFLFDYYFRGIEKMQILTVRFVLMRGIAALLTIAFVKSDSDIFLIPLFDLIGSLLAVGLVIYELKKSAISIKFTGIRAAVDKLKESFVYFASDMATTVFGALNTLLIGAFLPVMEVAYWSLSIQLISGVQTMYSPITGGIYPNMIKTKSFSFIKRLLMLFMPIILIGSICSYFIAPYILLIVGGKQYIAAQDVFRWLLPVLIFSFPAIVLGWPTLGALDKAKQVTNTTVLSAIVQIICLLLLLVLGYFNIFWIAVSRCLTELVLMLSRGAYCWKYKNEFNE